MPNSNSAFDLNSLDVASPCSANWDEMTGDEKVRLCQLCSQNVYDISGMSRQEAEGLVLATEGKICVQFYKRADGTVLTDDCPVALRAIRDAYRKTTFRCKAVAAGLASLFSAVFAICGVQAQDKSGTTDDKSTAKQNQTDSGTQLRGRPRLMGKMVPPRTSPEATAEQKARTEYQTAAEKIVLAKLPTSKDNGSYLVTVDKSGTVISATSLRSTGDKNRDNEIIDIIKATKFDSMPEALGMKADRTFLKLDLSNTQVP